jgi:K+-transporting ATPase A subunit
MYSIKNIIKNHLTSTRDQGEGNPCFLLYAAFNSATNNGCGYNGLLLNSG